MESVRRGCEPPPRLMGDDLDDAVIGAGFRRVLGVLGDSGCCWATMTEASI